MQSDFDVEVTNHGRTAVIAVVGELDLATSPTLEHELERASAGGSEAVIVDLRRVEFMDSTGLSVLVKAHQKAEEAAQPFAVVRGPKQVERLLSLTGVAGRIRLLDAPEEMLGED